LASESTRAGARALELQTGAEVTVDVTPARIMNTSRRSVPIAAQLRLALLVAVTLASSLHQARAQSGVPGAAPVLRDLAGLGELRSQFEIDRDNIRIVLLLSPT
jgi:hypothetical protein